MPLAEDARDECLRGFGLALARGRCADDPGACVPEGTPIRAQSRLWQGMGMGRGCEDPARLLEQAGDRWTRQVWWGLGRVEIQCLGEWDRRNRRAPKAYLDGWKAGWSYDLAAPGYRSVDEATLPRLRVYNFRWVQGPDF